METKFNYTIVGLFVVLLTAVIIVISLWLTVGLEQTVYKTYLVYMNESVAGLSLQSPVKYNGINVGFVTDMKLNRANPTEVILTLKLVSDTPVTVSTTATLMQQGVTGIAFIGLNGGKDRTPLQRLPGAKYPIIKSAPSLFVRLDQALQGITNNLDSLTDQVKLLLDKDNLDAIKGTLTNVQNITQAIANNNKEISEGMKSLAEILHNTSIASEDLPAALKSIATGAKAITSTAKKTSNAVQAFSNQIMPEAYGVLQKSNNIATNLQDLSDQMVQEPNVLIRGAQPHPPGPGEK
jgi:phospholipid/cholesterol/gamma-HCH transport system substrate-binding protein